MRIFFLGALFSNHRISVESRHFVFASLKMFLLCYISFLYSIRNLILALLGRFVFLSTGQIFRKKFLIVTILTNFCTRCPLCICSMKTFFAYQRFLRVFCPYFFYKTFLKKNVFAFVCEHLPFHFRPSFYKNQVYKKNHQPRGVNQLIIDEIPKILNFDIYRSYSDSPLDQPQKNFWK